MRIKKYFVVMATIALLISGTIIFNKLSVDSNTIFEKITADDLQVRINNKENMVVYYVSEQCSACKIFTPILSQAAENLDIKIYYLEDEEGNVQFADDYNLYVAPTLLMFKNDGVTRYEGSMELQETTTVLEYWRNNLD